MPLPIPWKSGKQSPVPYPFGLSPIYSRIGDLDQITILGIQDCIGWEPRIVALVLPGMVGGLEASGTEASLVVIITKE